MKIRIIFKHLLSSGIGSINAPNLTYRVPTGPRPSAAGRAEHRRRAVKNLWISLPHRSPSCLGGAPRMVPYQHFDVRLREAVCRCCRSTNGDRSRVSSPAGFDLDHSAVSPLIYGSGSELHFVPPGLIVLLQWKPSISGFVSNLSFRTLEQSLIRETICQR